MSAHFHLPKIILIASGDIEARRKLALAIVHNFTNVGITELRGPLREGVCAMFFGTQNPWSIQLEELEKEGYKLPGTSFSPSTFLQLLEGEMRKLSPSILGELGLHAMDFDLFSCHVVSDFERTEDAEPFLAAFGQDEILIIATPNSSYRLSDYGSVLVEPTLMDPAPIINALMQEFLVRESALKPTPDEAA